jgi:very-short-patch-repair endonuclease
LVTEIKRNSIISIICPEHGIFYQNYENHRQGRGCHICARINTTTASTNSFEDFVERSNLKHNNKYTYISYTTSKDKAGIICPEHGLFYQKAANHTFGDGCPKCKSSKGENRVRNYLLNSNILIDEQKTFKDCRHPDSNRRLRFDFYLPNINTIIEYDGIQHYKPHSFGSDRTTETQNINLLKVQIVDKIKNEYCIKNNIRLIRIPYWDFGNIEKILKKELSCEPVKFTSTGSLDDIFNLP